MYGLLLTLLLASADPVGVRATVRGRPTSSTCPADDPTTRHRLNLVLRDPRHVEFRSEVGLPALDTTTVRVLTDSANAATGTGLNTGITPQGGDVFIYYHGGWLLLCNLGRESVFTVT